jgi:formate dehydrogenase alpha subunit
VAGLATSFGSGAMTNPMQTSPIMRYNADYWFEYYRAAPVFRAKIRQAVYSVALGCCCRPVALISTDCHLPAPRPGTDIALIHGLMHIISRKAEDKIHRQPHRGFEDFKAVIDITSQLV